MGKVLIIKGADFSANAIDSITPSPTPTPTPTLTWYVNRTSVGTQRIGSTNYPNSVGDEDQTAIRNKSINRVRLYVPSIATTGTAIKVLKITNINTTYPNTDAANKVVIASEVVTTEKVTNGYVEFSFSTITLGANDFLLVENNKTSDSDSQGSVFLSVSDTCKALRWVEETNSIGYISSSGNTYGNMPWAVGYYG